MNAMAISEATRLHTCAAQHHLFLVMAPRTFVSLFAPFSQENVNSYHIPTGVSIHGYPDFHTDFSPIFVSFVTSHVKIFLEEKV